MQQKVQLYINSEDRDYINNVNRGNLILRIAD